jgi:translation initiation factor 5B
MLCYRVTSIQNNHKEVTSAKKGSSVAIKIVNESNPQMMYGRQFDHNTSLYSKQSRASIDALKEYFKRSQSLVCICMLMRNSMYICIAMLARRSGS